MIRELPVTELAKELADKNVSLEDANIWDVRDESAYIEGHISGASNQPINAGIDKQALDNAQGTVYVLCGGGSKAPRAANTLEDLDSSRDIVILTGGTRGAKSAGMDIVDGNKTM